MTTKITHTTRKDGKKSLPQFPAAGSGVMLWGYAYAR